MDQGGLTPYLQTESQDSPFHRLGFHARRPLECLVDNQSPQNSHIEELRQKQEGCECPHRGLGSAPTHHRGQLHGRSGKSHRTDYRGRQRESGGTELWGTPCDVHKCVLMVST